MNTIKTDVLIVGTGAAGIRAAFSVSRQNAEVVILAEGQATECGSTFSSFSGGWGIQALIGNERTDKNLAGFYDDVINVGLGEADPKLARILVEESGERLEELLSFGLEFNRVESGAYLRQEGCFSKVKRAFIAGNMDNIKQTFRAILDKSVAMIIKGYVIDLVIVDGICCGAFALDDKGTLIAIQAGAVILATGGGAGIFKSRFVSGNEAGAGCAIAGKAGAEIKNMEFIQFMLGMRVGNKKCFFPTSNLGEPNILVDSNGADALNTAIPEAKIRNMAIEQRMKHYPFSCRDYSGLIDIAVSRAVKENRELFFKNVNQGGEQTKVGHFAHAFNGGVRINENAETSIAGLFAAGEVAAGPHGADRIGGCMMTATQVFGNRAGRFAAERAKKRRDRGNDFKTEIVPNLNMFAKAGNVNAAYKEVALTINIAMDEYAMVGRSKEGLDKCKTVLDDCGNGLERLKSNVKIDAKGYFKLNNMITVAKLVTAAALKRTKSLGSHYREDDFKNVGLPESEV